MEITLKKWFVTNPKTKKEKKEFRFLSFLSKSTPTIAIAIIIATTPIAMVLIKVPLVTISD
jgi:hypothetical protein